LPNVLIGETGSITAGRTQSHTEAVESDEKQRGELLAMAIFWDFLAEHCPHHPANEIG
jgi:hypothetical protein